MLHHPPDPETCADCRTLTREGTDLRRFRAVEHRPAYSILPPRRRAEAAIPSTHWQAASAPA